MKYKALIFILLLLLTACKSSKKTVERSREKPSTVNVKNNIRENPKAKRENPSEEIDLAAQMANTIVETAFTYLGTKYRYGGTTPAGMDCSGLVHTAFKTHAISLPRSSYDIATRGEEISLDTVKKGDLLFFVTNGKSQRINHVGLVVEAGKEVKFIHATTSRGVLISSLSEGYWKYAFVKATRVL